ncbi:MAG: laccase domain-containing protein, partial [Clostridia bacterium]|nr:laccase domain-containing protein [Clostridia bacterium]
LAAIGPCIGNCCYQVGVEVYNEFVAVSQDYSSFFSPDGEKFKLDLVKANKFILEQAGILPQNISCANLCTLCNEEHFFSHRRSGSLRGTLGAFIHI